eukprot:TRINITY_DN31885_c0_g1_i2.p1 TRINITY_DN31885_c0_g1~~TRINITY_DN31885_c0_g1_i2.p1  ORF type:complete len:1469 (+),score=253.20 TRINITY_DN31885_c0_g1_i2:117-4523(+)
MEAIEAIEAASDSDEEQGSRSPAQTELDDDDEGISDVSDTLSDVVDPDPEGRVITQSVPSKLNSQSSEKATPVQPSNWQPAVLFNRAQSWTSQHCSWQHEQTGSTGSSNLPLPSAAGILGIGDPTKLYKEIAETAASYQDSGEHRGCSNTPCSEMGRAGREDLQAGTRSRASLELCHGYVNPWVACASVSRDASSHPERLPCESSSHHSEQCNGKSEGSSSASNGTCGSVANCQAEDACDPNLLQCLERLTMQQLRVLLEKHGVQPKSAASKGELVMHAIEAGCSQADAEACDTRLQLRMKAVKKPWSEPHRALYNRAPKNPSYETALHQLESALTSSVPPVTCDKCGAQLELVFAGGRTFVGCASFSSSTGGCGSRMGILKAYRYLEHRRTVTLEVCQPGDSFAIRVHRDLAAAVLSHLGLTPGSYTTVLALCHHARVVETLSPMCGASTPLNLRLRPVPNFTLSALNKTMTIGTNPDGQRLAALRRLKDEGLLRVLQEHQLRFIEWALPRQRVLCADDMGLGKSLQALAFLVANNAFPAIVICPAFARGAWATQIEQWGIARPGEYRVVRGGSSSLPNAANVNTTPKIVVISYTMLKQQFHPICRRHWKGFIVDESHRIGTSRSSEDDDENTGAAETQATLQLLKSASRETPIVLLSGTPGWTGTFDVYNQAQLLWPGLLGDTKWAFAQNFFHFWREPLPHRPACFTLAIGNCERPMELNVLLTRSIMLRRRRQEVLTSLPQLQLVEMPVELEIGHANFVLADFQITKTESGSWEGVATSWERTGLCKARGASEVLREKLGACKQAGEMAAVFVRHHRVRESVERILAEELPDLRLVSMFGERREAALHSFMAGGCDVAVCMVESCGVAIDLSKASVCIFVELPHTASEFNQAVARLHRQGQRSAVTAYVLLSRTSSDSKQDPKGLPAKLLSDCGRDDRKHWMKLMRRHEEAMQVLGDLKTASSEQESSEADEESNVAMSASQASQCSKGVQEGHPGAAKWLFLISGETHRLHIYDATSASHTGLMSRAPVVPDVPLCSADLMKCGSRRLLFNPADLSSLLEAANDFIVSHAALNAVDRRLLQCGGPGGAPVPTLAGGLTASLQALRKPGIVSKRRYAAPAMTQEAEHAGTAWARAEVLGRRGLMVYRQRVDAATDARYCMECLTQLQDAQNLPRLEEITSTSEIQNYNGAKYIVRYSCLAELFCGGQCRESYFVKRKSECARQALLALEGGICRRCGIDTEQLKVREAFFGESGAANSAERSMFARLTTARRLKLLENPKRANLWEADHVLAVADGGGESEITNFQTLCLACHGDKTKSEAAQRAEARRNVRSKRTTAELFGSEVSEGHGATASKMPKRERDAMGGQVLYQSERPKLPCLSKKEKHSLARLIRAMRLLQPALNLTELEAGGSVDATATARKSLCAAMAETFLNEILDEHEGGSLRKRKHEVKVRAMLTSILEEVG